MSYQESTTNPRSWSTWCEHNTITAWLREYRVPYEGFYPTCRQGIYQIEAYGNARSLFQRLENIPGFWPEAWTQDTMDDELYALVMFSYREPESPEVAAEYDRADDYYEDYRLQSRGGRR